MVCWWLTWTLCWTINPWDQGMLEDACQLNLCARLLHKIPGDWCLFLSKRKQFRGWQCSLCDSERCRSSCRLKSSFKEGRALCWFFQFTWIEFYNMCKMVWIQKWCFPSIVLLHFVFRWSMNLILGILWRQSYPINRVRYIEIDFRR